MKLIIFLVLLGLMFTAAASYAQSRDAYGNPVVLGAASEELGVPPPMFDLGIGLGAVGANDDTGETEVGILGASLWWYPDVHPEKKWLKIGAAADWQTGDRSKIEFSLLPDFMPFSGPDSNLLWHVTLDLLPHFVARMDVNEEATSSWSWAPGAQVSVEYPMGDYGILVGVSANRLLNREGDTENDITELGAGAQVLLRLGR